MTWTTHSAAPEWDINVKTLRRMLAAAGHDLNEKKNFTTPEISRAVHAAGDLKSEKTRETKFRADLLELEHKQKLGDLVTLADVQRMMTETFQPIRDLINQLPSQVASRCNPTDPQCAMQALEEWKKVALPLIRGAWPDKPNDTATS